MRTMSPVNSISVPSPSAAGAQLHPFDQGPQQLEGLAAFGAVVGQRVAEVGNLGPVEFGEVGVQAGQGTVAFGQPVGQLLLAGFKVVKLLLEAGCSKTVTALTRS
jgi:hypothetical protein